MTTPLRGEIDGSHAAHGERALDPGATQVSAKQQICVLPASTLSSTHGGVVASPLVGVWLTASYGQE
jgi:hypothetical protein